MSEYVSVCIDFGSHKVKSGSIGDSDPRSVIRSLIGSPLHRVGMWGSGTRDNYVGDEAQEHRSILSLRHPIHRGQIVDWDDFERLFAHVLNNELREPAPNAILLAEPSFNSRHQREKMTMYMFENFNTDNGYLAPSPILNLYASGRTTGTVIEVGDGLTQVASIMEGYLIQSGCARLNTLAGSDLDEYLLRLLALYSDIHMDNTILNRDIVREIKEKMCYLATSSDNFHELNKEATQRSVHQEYEMSDGKKIKIANEMWQCPEALFNPKKYLERDIPGIHQLLVDCIQNCATDTRKHLYSNIIVSGGTTFLPNFATRFKKEVEALVPHNSSVKIVASEDRKFSTWIGCSILGSMGHSDFYLTKAMYEENGPYAMHARLCQMVKYE